MRPSRAAAFRAPSDRPPQWLRQSQARFQWGHRRYPQDGQNTLVCPALRRVVRSQIHCVTGPGGQPYYFNVHTSESTYVRPLPAFPIINPAVVAPAPAPKPVKDKPLVKTPIPGTDWIRVKTTQGNTFYSHKVEKRSVWTVPDEIKDAVEALEKEEQGAAERLIREQEEEAARIETERVKAQIAKETAKRKAQDPVPVDEVVISKKAQIGRAHV